MYILNPNFIEDTLNIFFLVSDCSSHFVNGAFYKVELLSLVNSNLPVLSFHKSWFGCSVWNSFAKPRLSTLVYCTFNSTIWFEPVFLKKKKEKCLHFLIICVIFSHIQISNCLTYCWKAIFSAQSHLYAFVKHQLAIFA